MPRVVRQQQAALKPFWTTDDGSHVRLYHGDVCKVLAGLPEKSVQCCITSPPYWALRDYGVTGQLGSEEVPDCGHHTCGECFVCHMLAVFRGVYRVLRDNGVLFLNLGDSYTGGGRNSGRPEGYESKQDTNAGSMHSIPSYKGMPRGNLVGVPWRVALALQSDGWVLRSDIPWIKRTPMPESVTNRPTKALEYVFMLTKSATYFSDFEAIRSKATSGKQRDGFRGGDGTKYKYKYTNGRSYDNSAEAITGGGSVEGESTRNFRQSDLWYQSLEAPHGLCGIGDDLVGIDLSTEPFSAAHFATFGGNLVRPLMLCGTSEHGCCADCGSPWKRVTEKTQLKRERPNDYTKRTGEEGTGNSCGNTVAGVDVRTVGWEKSCSCETDEIVPCTVLDPFIGSRTVCDVAVRLGRRSVGIDLNADYLRNFAVPRVTAACLAGPDEVKELVRSSRPKPKRMW